MATAHPQIKEIKFTLNRIFRNPSAVTGFLLLFFFLIIALGAPYIAPPKNVHEPYMMPHKGYSQSPKPPSDTNIFGTTSGQYDIFYGVVWGTRTAFRIGLFVGCIAAFVGISLGVIAGFYGGLIDEILMRFLDVFYAIPLLVLAMAIVVSFGPGIDNVMYSIALVRWRHYVRLMRSSVMVLRDLDFVKAARVLGVSDTKIIFRHLLPNGIYPSLVLASMDIGTIVLTAAFMSFLGLGAPKGYADWGQMVALARNYIIGPPGDPLKYWYTIVIPGACIVLFVLAWNLIGDALRDAFDPKIRRR